MVELAVSAEPETLLRTVDLEKTFHQGSESLSILHNANIEIRAGEIVALVGPSGAGKSTLLQLAGLLDRPSGGQIFIGGREAGYLPDRERTLIRREVAGFVYQFHYLLPEFSALENVVVPQMIAGVKRSEAEGRARELLEALKLSHRLDHRPGRLSGGEQQRVAIARALANRPMLLFADEPTGNLDPETSEIVFDMLTSLVRSAGIGALIATHNIELAEQMDRILEIKGGRVIEY